MCERAGPVRHLVSSSAGQCRSSAPIGELLANLAQNHGISTDDAAAALGIRAPTLRLWRHSCAESQDAHRKVSDFVTFVAALAEVVDAPSRWLSAPLVSGYNVTALDVYTTERAATLLELAAGVDGVTAAGALDGMLPGWREQWRSEYAVFVAHDGDRSLRPRPAGRPAD